MSVIHNYLDNLQQTIDRLPLEGIHDVIQLLHEARMNQQRVFVMGNGGSASTASHLACDLMKNSRVEGSPDVSVFGLTDNVAILSAYANDEGYENVFTGQLNSLLRPDDVVIAISTSGRSPNVLRAIELANRLGGCTVGFTGDFDSPLAKLVQINITVPNISADQIEDVHLIIGHMITRALKELAQPTMVTLDQPNTMISLPLSSNGHSSSNGETHHNGNGNGSLAQLLQAMQQEDQLPIGILESPGLLSELLMLVVVAIGAESGSIALLSEDGRLRNALLNYSGQVRRASSRRMGRVLEKGLAGWVLENRKATLVTNTREDDRWLDQMVMGGVENGKTALCTPLLVCEQVIGVLTLSRPESEPFTLQDLVRLTAVTTAITSPLIIDCQT